MTSANVSEFIIYDKDGNSVGRHRQNWLCKTSFNLLLKFQPLEDHEILEFWYDEDEEYHEGEKINLKQFLSKCAITSPELRGKI